jgi:ribosomal protein S18 acetylase RimI-like enzyme
MDITIRFAEEEDLDALVELWVDFMGNGFDILSNLKITPENIKRWKSLAHMYILQKMIKVAAANGRVVAYILMNYGIPPLDTIYRCANILDLYVKKEYRKRGIGTLLLKDGMDYLKEQGFQLVALNVLTENFEALSLYEREGFHKVFYTLKRYL